MSPTSNPALVSRGKALIQQHRCQQCHRLPTDWKLAITEPIALDFDSISWKNSCAGKIHPLNPRQPAYGLSNEQQEALQVYWTDLPRENIDKERALDGKFLLRERNCLGCHSRGSVHGLG